MRVRVLFIAFFLLFSWQGTAQNPQRELTGLTQDGNKITVTTNDGVYTILYYNENIVETTFIPKGQSFKKESHAVILEPEKVELIANTSGGRTGIISDGILKSEREYYNDDGKTPNAFEKGMYELWEFEMEIDKKWIEIDFEAELGANYKTSQKTVKLVVHNIDWRPRIVRINGKKAGLNKIGNTLVIPVNWNTQEEAKIKISLEAK